MTQKFSYHTHTNTFGIFDGRNSAFEMIQQAEKLGWDTIGISNHLIFHPDIVSVHPIYFNDYNEAYDVYQRNIEHIRTVALKFKINVLVGAEVDFFPDLTWENQFSRMKETLDIDYWIGSSHNLFLNGQYISLHNLYVNHKNKDKEVLSALKHYWEISNLCAKSGLFDFLAHIDLPTRYEFDNGFEHQEEKEILLNTIIEQKIPIELNTAGWNSPLQCQHPHDWILKKLKDSEILIVINDDAHSVSDLGRDFDKAEELLKSLKYTYRFEIKKH